MKNRVWLVEYYTLIGGGYYNSSIAGVYSSRENALAKVSPKDYKIINILNDGGIKFQRNSINNYNYHNCIIIPYFLDE